MEEPGDLVNTVFILGTLFAFLLWTPFLFIGWNVRKFAWESSIKKATESSKFNIFWFPYQWAAKGKWARVYVLYLFEALTLGWLMGYVYYVVEVL